MNIIETVTTDVVLVYTILFVSSFEFRISELNEAFKFS